MDPSFEFIWWCLTCSSLLMAVFSASTFQNFNWGIFVFLFTFFILVVFKMNRYLLIEDQKLIFHFLAKKKSQIIDRQEISEIFINPKNKKIELFGYKNELLISFYLPKRKQQLFRELIEKKLFTI